MVNSKRKGANGEREWVKICREHGYDCRRSQQYCGGTQESADVVGLPYVYQEVKYGYDMTVEEIRGFVVRALSDAAQAEKYAIPIVAHKKTYGKWFVSMETQDFVCMYMIALNEYGTVVDPVSQDITYVTMPADDWFNIYREFEASKAIKDRRGA